MKKILVFICILFSFFIFSAANINAQTFENNKLLTSSTEVITYADGSYIVISLFVNEDITRPKQAIALNNSNIKIGNKNAVHYHADGTVLWTFTVTGYFQITPNVSCTCISATYNQTISSSVWHFSDGQAGYYGNVAYGKGTFKHKTWFITLKTIYVDISISCDANGNLY